MSVAATYCMLTQASCWYAACKTSTMTRPLCASARADVSEKCRHAPFLVPFMERAQVFQEVVVSLDRSARQQDMSPFSFSHDAPRFITVRRDHMLQVGPFACWEYMYLE